MRSWTDLVGPEGGDGGPLPLREHVPGAGGGDEAGEVGHGDGVVERGKRGHGARRVEQAKRAKMYGNRVAKSA